MAVRKNRQPGLHQRGSVWHIDKTLHIEGERVTLRESTGTADYHEAERVLHRRIEDYRRRLSGGAGRHRWTEARDRFLQESRGLASHPDIERYLHMADPWLEGLWLHQVCYEALEPFVEKRLEHDGVKQGTVNATLKWVRRVTQKAAHRWRDPATGAPWLQTPPHIPLLPVEDARDPWPLSWEEQNQLFPHLPSWLASIALFMVNAGPRPGEVLQLRWSWERQLEEGFSVFVLPAAYTKGRRERILVPNHIAQSVLEGQRGKHPDRVFPGQDGAPLARVDRAWTQAREAAFESLTADSKNPSYGLASVRLHDLRHTFGRRLRAAGVPEEDRRDLLGHKGGSITTHYSMAEVQRLYEAACLAGDRQATSASTALIRAAT